MSTEPDAPKLGGLSLGDDKSTTSSANGTKANPAAAIFTPSGPGFKWSDEDDSTATGSDKKAGGDGANQADIEKAQVDGAGHFMAGSKGLNEPEFDVNVKLADLQEDPNNPLYSVKKFEELSLKAELSTGLDLMGFQKPSKIQERALPLLLKDPPQNFIGQSQSGTGKTAAFVLNVLQRVDLSINKPQALILAPTRELARQIAGVAQTMGVKLLEKGLRISQSVPDPETRGKPVEGQVVVGTPGTVMDQLKRRLLDARGIKVLTLDEADNMLDLQGMADQCKRVKQQLPRTAQVVLFSATFPPDVLAFAEQFSPKSNMITLKVEELSVKGIRQMYLDCQNDEEKYAALLKFYGLMTIGSSVIFVKHRETAVQIDRRMTAEGHNVASLTGAKEGAERDETFRKFQKGEAKVLIATNVLSRGIDVSTVTMVVNYDIPETVDGQPDFETYLHRIGRTGRFGRTGAALSFVHDRKSWQSLMAICKHFGVEPTKLDTSDWDEVERNIKAIMKNSRNNINIEEIDMS